MSDGLNTTSAIHLVTRLQSSASSDALGLSWGSASTPAPKQSAELRQRLEVAKTRLETAARNGQRVRAYEVALDLDLSEFHFARQFRIAFDCSPHAFYDEVRAVRARELLGEGHTEGVVARRVGFRRPAELRALLQKRGVPSAA